MAGAPRAAGAWGLKRTPSKRTSESLVPSQR